MSGRVEARQSYHDHGISPWERAFFIVALSLVLIFWTALALTVGYTCLGFAKILGPIFRIFRRLPHD